MGVGSATGKEKAEQAAREAISSPLLETSIKGAKGILMNIYVSPDVALEDAELASTLIAQEANPDANIIWGVTFDEDLDDEMRITIVATGCEKKPEDATRVINKVETNHNSPFPKKEAAAPAASKAAPKAEAPAAKPAAQPVKKPMPKPAPKAAPKDEDDFDDLFDLFKKK